VELLPNFPRIEELFARMRVLLMPSLWYEGFGLVVMQAMLHGIPVVASDSGGLVEAKTGTGFVVPAPHVERYEPVYDERAMPRPVVGEVNLEPWTEALATLLSNRAAYQQESEASRRTAQRFVNSLPAAAMERFLSALAPAAAVPAAASAHSIEHLSPEKRALLLQRLRRQGQA
jgi:glycosyltransferase involved in cell wall biosynthesis